MSLGAHCACCIRGGQANRPLSDAVLEPDSIFFAMVQLAIRFQTCSPHCLGRRCPLLPARWKGPSPQALGRQPNWLARHVRTPGTTGSLSETAQSACKLTCRQSIPGSSDATTQKTWSCFYSAAAPLRWLRQSSYGRDLFKSTCESAGALACIGGSRTMLS